MSEFAKKIKELREEKFPGEGLRKVAPLLGIDYTHLGKIESGGYLPSVDVLTKLLSLYKPSSIDQKTLYDLYVHARLNHAVSDLNDATPRSIGYEIALRRTSKKIPKR